MGSNEGWGFQTMGFAAAPDGSLHIAYTPLGIYFRSRNGTAWVTENLIRFNTKATMVDPAVPRIDGKDPASVTGTIRLVAAQDYDHASVTLRVSPMIDAFILCAGLGTRLRPLSEHIPKPLVPVVDRPAVKYAVDRLRGLGARIALNAFHRAELVCEFAAEEGLIAVREGSLLGTAGGLQNAGAALGEGDILVWNGDILADLDVPALLASHRASRAEATLAVAPRSPGEGTVGLGAEGQIVRLRGERFGEELSGGEFLGIHVVGQALREGLPEVGCLVGDVYLPALRRGARLATHVERAPFFDIGSPGGYLGAMLHELARRQVSSWIHGSARVSPGVTVTASSVGPGAEVSASIASSIVWPETRVTEPLHRAIATPFGILRACPSELQALP